MEKKVVIPDTHKYIAIFLTMRCNLNCSFCLNALDKSKEFNRLKFKELSGEQWVKALNKISSRSEVPLSFSGGEPSLHRDFIYIIKNLNSDLNIDILTNLQWNEEKVNDFIREINPEKINRQAPYPPIRVSYHPEQMGAGDLLIKNAEKLKQAGFNLGIYSVLYPHPKQLESITQMQFRCREVGVDFRVKDFTGTYKGELYGNYSKYLGSVGSDKLKECLCKTSELLIAPNGNVYRCHRDLFAEENPIGNITDPEFEIQNAFKYCDKYGDCHPCDVKVKTNYKQELGHTSVEIQDVKDSANF